MKKDIVAMVVKDLKSKAGQRKPKKDNSDDEDEVYSLVRGNKSTLMVQRLDEEENYKPARKERAIMMISSDESDLSDYVPKRRKMDDEVEVVKNDERGNSGSSSSSPNNSSKQIKKERLKTEDR